MFCTWNTYDSVLDVLVDGHHRLESQKIVGLPSASDERPPVSGVGPDSSLQGATF